MLYKSLQSTIQEYKQRKKETQSEGDRKMFKWKVFALSFAILVIILIGIISQLIENDQQDEAEVRNMTFLTSILQHSQQLILITSIKGLIHGLSSTQRIIFDNSQLIHISDSFNTIELIQNITNKRNMVFLFNLKQVNETTGQQQQHRFGMLLKQQYDNIDPDGNNDVEIYDSIDDMTSVYFSLDHKNALQMSMYSRCALYNFSMTSGDFEVMETLRFKKEEGQEEHKDAEFGLWNWKCFGESELEALEEINKLTGVELTDVKEVKKLQIQSMEVFYLTFNGGNI